MAHFYPSDAAFDIDILPLPKVLRWLSTALMLGFTAWGGLLDRQRRAEAGTGNLVAPLGAMMALLAATLFAPIAWTHYFIVLFLPLMLLVDVNRSWRSGWLWAAVVAVLALSFQPLATDIIHVELGRFSIVRGQFFSGILALGAIATVAVRQARHHSGTSAVPAREDKLASVAA